MANFVSLVKSIDLIFIIGFIYLQKVMNIKDLQYLLAVADLRHFGKAAEHCHISQPTLSMQLKKLEAELGIQLFERQHKNVMTTSAGEKIIAQTRVIIEQVNHLKTLAQHIRDPLSGEFHLGAIPTVGPYLLPHILPALKKQLPNMHFYLQEGQTHQVVEQLRKGQLDAVILALPISGIEEFICRPLFRENFILALPIDHRLVHQVEVTTANIDAEELLLLGEGHCLKDHALDVCQHIKNQYHPRYQGTSLEMLKHMVAMGEGITLLPQLAANETRHQQIALKSFKHPAPHRKIGMLWRVSSAKKACCSQIIDCIQQVMAKQPGIEISSY